MKLDGDLFLQGCYKLSEFVPNLLTTCTRAVTSNGGFF